MFKIKLRHYWNRFCELGNAPSSSPSSKRNSFRSGFQRSVWAFIFLFGYLVLASKRLYGAKASMNNNGIYLLLLFGMIAAGMGAFFAPRISAFIHSQSLSGRREKSSKSRQSSRSQSGRRHHRERSSGGSSNQSRQTETVDSASELSQAASSDSTHSGRSN